MFGHITPKGPFSKSVIPEKSVTEIYKNFQKKSVKRGQIPKICYVKQVFCGFLCIRGKLLPNWKDFY
jgi:hypothetical protein